MVANRTWDRAAGPGRARRRPRPCGSSTSPAALAEVDVLLTSTGATSIMLEHADIEPVVERPRRPARC